jgi:hypothetical protein
MTRCTLALILVLVYAGHLAAAAAGDQEPNWRRAMLIAADNNDTPNSYDGIRMRSKNDAPCCLGGRRLNVVAADGSHGKTIQAVANAVDEDAQVGAPEPLASPNAKTALTSMLHPVQALFETGPRGRKRDEDGLAVVGAEAGGR